MQASLKRTLVQPEDYEPATIAKGNKSVSSRAAKKTSAVEVGSALYVRAHRSNSQQIDQIGPMRLFSPHAP